MGTFTPTSLLFDKATRRRTIGNLVSRAARDFKRLTQERMIRGPHSGRLYAKKRTASARRSHRASAKGQRPSPDTMTLVNAIASRRKLELVSEVYIAEKTNPSNGTVASEYGERLQNDMNRPIMSEADAFQAEYKLRQDAELLIKRML